MFVGEEQPITFNDQLLLIRYQSAGAAPAAWR